MHFKARRSSGWIQLEDVCSPSCARVYAVTGGTASRAAVALRSCPSTLLELDQYGRRARKRPLEDRLRRHIEWRLSPPRWPQDLPLQLAVEQHGGWAPLSSSGGGGEALLESDEARQIFSLEGVADEPEERRRCAAAAVHSSGGATLLELSPDERAVRIAGLPRRVQWQVEQLVAGDGRTRELQEVACSSAGGYIPLAALASLPELEALLLPGTPTAALAAALRPSALLELSDDELGVRSAGAASMEIDDGSGPDAACESEPPLPSPDPAKPTSKDGTMPPPPATLPPAAAPAAPAAPTAAAAAAAAAAVSTSAAAPATAAVSAARPTAAATPGAATAGGGYAFLPSGGIPGASGAAFTAVTFNLLADYLARSELHAYCPWPLRRWPQRVARIVRGLQRAAADIVCLQEVQGVARASSSDEARQNHHAQLDELLRGHGYTSGTLALRCAADGTVKAHRSLGNAIFFRPATFERAPLSGGGAGAGGSWRGRVNLAQELAGRCHSSEQMRRYVFHKEQSAGWVRLRHRASGRVVVAVSCHIACDFLNPDAQVAQTHALLSRLEAGVVQPGDALLLCGDFNSLPASGVHELVTTGSLPLDHEHARAPDVRIRPPLPGGGFGGVGGGGWKHGLQLSSAYETLGSEPHLTNKTPEFEGTIDYVFASPELVPRGALPTPTSEEAAREGGGLPSSLVPSDHVPLGVSFGFA